MAEKVAPAKTVKTNKQVNGTISGALHAGLEDYRWENRIDKFGDIVALALQEFADNHGVKIAAADAGTDSAKA